MYQIQNDGHSNLVFDDYRQKSSTFWNRCIGFFSRTVGPRKLSFSQFVVLMSTLICEKDSLLGHMVLEKTISQNFEGSHFLAGNQLYEL